MPDWKLHIRSHLAPLRLSPAREHEIIEELSQHLEDRWRELVDGGASEDQATELALAGLRDGHLLTGHLAPLRQAHAPLPVTPGAPAGRRLLGDLWQDLRYAVRTLRKQPTFVLAAVLTLALGIGANAAMFSVVDGALLRPLPYDHPEQIVSMDEQSPDGTLNGGVSTANFLDWRAGSTSFAAMAAVRRINMTLVGRGEPLILSGERVSASYFDVWGTQPAIGRTFELGEEVPGKDHVVVLSHRLWVTQFGADRSLVGRTLTLNSEPYTVIGVMPEGSKFDRTSALFWRPLAFSDAERTRHVRWFSVVGRLKPDVTLQRARAEMDTIGVRIGRDYPESNKGWGVSLERLADVIVGPQLQRSLYVLLAAVGMLLLIACANLANLTLARGTSREREVAVRVALGAGRWRLVRQFLTESVVLALVGGILGVGVGYGGVRALRAFVPPGMLPQDARLLMDARVLVFCIALSVATGVLFGLAPALHALAPNVGAVMKEGGRGSAGESRRGGLRRALVVAEFALAFVLLVGGTLLLRSVSRMLSEPLSVDETRVLTMWLPVADNRFPDPAALLAYQHAVVERVTTVPGVGGVATAGELPLQRWDRGVAFLIAGGTNVDRANRNNAGFKAVGPSYFGVLGIPILRGRALSDRDVSGSTPVAVVNESFARRFFAGKDPIGQHLLIAQVIPGRYQLGPDIPWEIVGVMANEHANSLDATADRAGIYVPLEQSPIPSVNLVLRATVEPQTMSRAVVSAIHELNRDQVVTSVATLDQIKRDTTASPRFQAVLLGIFAALALVLSATGVYGVMSYAVSQRTREIGLRAALGASPRDVRRLVLRGGMTLTALGLAIGVAAALAVTRLLSSLMFGISPRDPLTLGVSAVLLTMVALLACYLPARRAARIDPLVALRKE
jgi:putative ABC transport system permease protein